ncbi:MAG: hypothetical protein AAGB31_12235, partial [Bdellovibrio sp.]
VIRNPKAVKSWSANSDQLVADLTKIKSVAAGAASSHMDMTIMLIKGELNTMPKKVYINSSARLDIAEILKDPKKVREIPILSLIDMIAAAPDKSISPGNKKKHYVDHLERALKDQVLSFDDYIPLLNANNDVMEAFKNAIANIDMGNINNYNSVTLISAVDKLNITMSVPKIRALWKSLWTSKMSYESLLKMNFKKAGEVLKQFDAFIPPNSNIDGLQDSNVGFLLTLLDSYLPSGSNYTDLTEKLLGKLIEGPYFYNADLIFTNLKNTSLNKEDAAKQLLVNFSSQPNAKYDLLATAALFDRTRKSLSSDQIKRLETEIAKLSLKVNSRLSYLLLEDYKGGQLKLPPFVSRTLFLNKLVERSISERSLGANTTNTYRMILSGYYSVFAKDFQTDDASAKRRAEKEASSYFMQLAQILQNSKEGRYAYASWQNAHLFEASMRYKAHPVESGIDYYKDGNAAADLQIERFVSESFDSSMLLYLVENIKSGGVIGKKSEGLLEKMLENYISPQFQKFIETKEFVVTDIERRIWSNFWKHPEYANSGNIRSDLCSFNQFLHSQEAVISSKLPVLWKSVNDVKNKIYARCSN